MLYKTRVTVWLHAHLMGMMIKNPAAHECRLFDARHPVVCCPHLLHTIKHCNGDLGTCIGVQHCLVPLGCRWAHLRTHASGHQGCMLLPWTSSTHHRHRLWWKSTAFKSREGGGYAYFLGGRGVCDAPLCCTSFAPHITHSLQQRCGDYHPSMRSH